VDKLRKALNVAKCVMQVKALQTDVAIEELEEFAKKSKSNQELNKKKLSFSSDYESKSDQYLSQIQELSNNLDMKSSELIKARKRIADLERKTNLDEKMIEELKEEVAGLKSEQQMDIQETIDDEMMMMKLREKNKQIQGLLDELKEMNNVNIELAKQVKLLKDELQQATSELKLAGEEIGKVRNELNQVQEMNRTTIKEKKYLLKEMDDLKQNLEKYESQDDLVAIKLNEKIDKLLSLMEVKDEQIDKLKLQLKQKIELLEMSDSNELVKKMQVKDEKVEYLKNQLNQAVNDMESQNKIIENLMKKSQGRREDREDREEESLTYQKQVSLSSSF
jgi:viral A-type inclusion protein, putative